MDQRDHFIFLDRFHNSDHNKVYGPLREGIILLEILMKSGGTMMKSFLLFTFLILFCLTTFACNNEKTSSSESGWAPEPVATTSTLANENATEPLSIDDTKMDMQIDSNPINEITHTEMFDGSVRITTVVDNPGNWTFAWYVFDQDKKKIGQQWYIKANSFEYTFPESGKYRIQAFVRNKDGGFNKFSDWITVN